MNLFDKLRSSLAKAIAPTPAMSSGHRAAAGGRTGYMFEKQRLGPNTTASLDLAKARERARALEINNPHAVGAIDGWQTGAIGLGIQPVFQHAKKAYVEELKTAWKRWEPHADFDERYDLGGRLGCLFGSVVRDGEALLRFRNLEIEPGIVPLQLQQLESDHLPDNKLGGQFTVSGDNYVVMGVEFVGSGPRAGKRAAYHVYKTHPGETGMPARGKAAGETERIPVADMIHIHRPKRAGECRSVTWLAPVMTRLAKIDDFGEAALERSQIAAKITGIAVGGDKSSGLLAPYEGEGGTAPAESEASESVEVESGTIVNCDEFQDIKFPDLPDFGVGLKEFSDDQLRAVAVGIGRTAWRVSGNYSDVNYSSIRAGESADNRRTDVAVWSFFMTQAMRPIVKRFMQAGCLGVFSAELTAAILQDFSSFTIDFTTHAHPFVDPLKESLADAEDVKQGFTSRSEVIRRRGGIPDDVFAEIASEQKLFKQLKIQVGEPAKQPANNNAAARAQRSLFAELGNEEQIQ